MKSIIESLLPPKRPPQVKHSGIDPLLPVTDYSSCTVPITSEKIKKTFGSFFIFLALGPLLIRATNRRKKICIPT